VVAALDYWYFVAAPVLTEEDTILIADFANTTGEDIFDGTLKEALAIKLDESPILNLFPEQEVRETLIMMELPADSRLTAEIAREICVRQNIKVFVAGTISSIGTHYVISLRAEEARSGNPLAREQEESESKEEVLGTLGKATRALREKLGESLTSVEGFDQPIESLTTSSLEALKAYTQGFEQKMALRFDQAIPHVKNPHP